MAVQIRSLSQATLNEAHRMALQSNTWRRGTSRRTGEVFWILDSRSEPGVAHWVALDARGCTCKGFNRRGDCAHAEAVRMVNARERYARPILSLDEIYRREDSRLVAAF